MKHRLYVQKKASSTSQLTPANQFGSRPFAPPTEASPQQQQTPDLQTQRENAERLGHNFANIPIFAPNSTPTPIQPKLTIGQPGDRYEQEADAVARQVVSQINSPQTVQREEMPEEEDELMMKSESGTIQREELPEEEEELQMKPMVQFQADGEMAASSDLEASIQQARGSGQPLSDRIREPMEQAFGADFSGVKVHADATSERLNQSIQAKAFTTGTDIFFRQGAYNPGSRGGQELIAHELTHVVQQNAGIVQQGQAQTLPAGNHAIQPWRDENGKFHDGARPPNADTDWEQFTTPQGQLRWRPKSGSAAAKEVEEAKKLKTSEAEAEKSEKDYTAVFLMDPATIRFSQDSISAYFKDESSVESLASSLKAGRVKADDVQPIMLVQRKQKGKPRLITLDNRRLWAFKEAGKQVRCRWATPEEITANLFKFTAGNGSKFGRATITIRK